MALMQCEGISFWCGDKHVQPSNYSNPTSIYSNQKKKKNSFNPCLEVSSQVDQIVQIN